MRGLLTPSLASGQRIEETVNRITRLNSHLVTTGTSPHESIHDGILIHPSLPSPHMVADVAFREIAHLHPTDHSLHVLLAPQDCKTGMLELSLRREGNVSPSLCSNLNRAPDFILTVISHGWGERHKLGCSRALRLLPTRAKVYIPKEYIWIYAPRDGQELAVLEKILIAAVSYMTGMKAEDGKQ